MDNGKIVRIVYVPKREERVKNWPVKKDDKRGDRIAAPNWPVKVPARKKEEVEVVR